MDETDYGPCDLYSTNCPVCTEEHDFGNEAEMRKKVADWDTEAIMHVRRLARKTLPEKRAIALVLRLDGLLAALTDERGKTK